MEPNAIPLNKLGIPPEFARYVDPDSPKEFRVLAARGVIPAPPRTLIAIQYCLLADPDPMVSTSASEGLLSHPIKVLENALDDRTHSKILEFFAFNRSDQEPFVEQIILKRQLNDRSICFLAEVVSARLLDIISNNQERLLSTPALFEHIKKNPAASRAMIDRVDAFLRLYRDEEPEFSAPSPFVRASGVGGGTFTAGSSEEASGAGSTAGAVHSGASGNRDLLEFKHGFESEEDAFARELVEEKEGLTQAQIEEAAEKQGDLWSTIGKLPMSKKIKLAYFGNAEARAILIRDRNKIVSTSVMKSPRLTISEVIAIAKNRNVCDEVIREVARNKEWYKAYQVRVSLVGNPKCPAQVAIPIISQLQKHDLKQLSMNRNVSHVVMMAARNLMKKKEA